MQNADLIGTVNPDFERFIISKDSKAHIETNILLLFTSNERDKLRTMGMRFEGLMSAKT